MDFLHIRKKARERAQARAAEDGKAREAPAPPGDLPLPQVEPGGEELVARLQAIPEPPGARPAPGPGASAEDPRFTTWTPGVGAAPFIPEPTPVQPPADVMLRPEDFALVATPAAAALPGVTPFTLVHPDARVVRAAVPVALSSLASPDPLDEFFFRNDEAGPVLPELAAPAAATSPQPAEAARVEFLTFLLGAEEYAVEIERVREVVKAPPITEVPRAPAHILGVVTVRGEVVAVVDPRRRLGLPPAALGVGVGRIVIVDAGDGPCGLHVDRVASVVRLPRGSIEPCPQGISSQRSELLAGIGRVGDRLFTVLDLGAVLKRAAPRPDPLARRADAGA